MTTTSNEPRATRLVIVGGGIGGTTVAKRLANDRRFEITLIDRQNHFVFQPLLYQVATAALGSADIAVPIRHMLRDAANVAVLQSEVRGIRAHARLVDTDAGPVPYDALVVAAGVESSWFGREDWESVAPGLKTLDDAARIRARVLAAFERAEATTDANERARHLTFVVVGGGPTGVELAGALAELARDALSREFRRIDTRQARIVLVEAGPRLMPMFHPDLSASAADDLRARGVEVRLDTRLTDITPDGVALGTKWIPASNVIWAAGVKASPLGESLPAERDAWGRVKVEPDCSLPGHAEIFVIGDLGHFHSAAKGEALPAVGGVALQQGNHVARQLRGDQLGRPRRAFAYFDRGQMATIGRNHAITEIRKLRFAGCFAWWLWLGVHIVFLAGFRNRLTVLLHWAWCYVTYDRHSRLIVLPGKPAPVPAAGGGTHPHSTISAAAPAPADSVARPYAAASSVHVDA
jgi:NADH:ubiquinone reductase (H+-translocating)